MAKPSTGSFELQRVCAQEWNFNQTTRCDRLGHQSWEGMVKIFGCDDSPKVGAEIAEANANLIAEAFNVYTETGMTPRELKELARTWENEAERRSRRYEADVSALRNELDATKAQGGGK